MGERPFLSIEAEQSQEAFWRRVVPVVRRKKRELGPSVPSCRHTRANRLLNRAVIIEFTLRGIVICGYGQYVKARPGSENANPRRASGVATKNGAHPCMRSIGPGR